MKKKLTLCQAARCSFIYRRDSTEPSNHVTNACHEQLVEGEVDAEDDAGILPRSA
jgi:hypothetical protein